MSNNIAKKFYLTEESRVYLSILKNDKQQTQSEIVNDAIKYYYDNIYNNSDNDSLKDSIAELKRILLNSRSQDDLDKEKIFAYFDNLWLGLRITDIPIAEATNESLNNFKAKLESNDFND